MEDDSGKAQRRKTLGIFLILVASSTIMLLLSTKSLTSVPERVGFSVSYVFQSVFHGVGSFFDSTFDSIAELKKLKVNYKDALKKIESYEKIEQGYASLERENADLRQQLNLSQQVPYTLSAAQIIAKDPGNINSTIVINKGSKDGIKKDYPVIAIQNGVQGLVGRVLEVGLVSSIVLPVYDSTSYVAARLERSRYEGLVQGQQGNDNSLILRYVEKSAKSEIQFGDVVSTSGLKGFYPSGIVIGRIKSQKEQSYQTSMEYVLDPALDFGRLEYVFVVFPGEILQ
jgi:rod shape-determining protein MreC